MFRRGENFKMDLQKNLKLKNVEILSGPKDPLEDNPDKWLEMKRFRAHVLFKQDTSRIQKVYSNCNGKTVQATFERLRREVEDIHFAHVCGPRLFHLIPVVEYTAGSCDRFGKRGEITFKTKKGRFYRTIRLSLNEQPPSTVFPKNHRDNFIKLEVFEKIPDNLNLRQIFNHFLSSGDLLIDFIVNKLWPIMEAAEIAKRGGVEAEKQLPQIPEHPKKEVQIVPTVNLSMNQHRSFAGNDRPQRFNSNNNNTFSHSGQRFYADRGGRHDRGRGDRFGGRGSGAGPRDGGHRDGPRDGHRDGPRDGHRDGPRDGHRDGPRENRDNNQRDRPPRGQGELVPQIGFGPSSVTPAQDTRKDRMPPPLMSGYTARNGGPVGGNPRFRGSGRRGASDNSHWRNKDRPTPPPPHQQNQQQQQNQQAAKGEQ